MKRRTSFYGLDSEEPVSNATLNYSSLPRNHRSDEWISFLKSNTQKLSRPSLTLRDSVLRILSDHRDQPRLIPRRRGRSNVRSSNLPAYTEYIFFLICDLPWLQLFILTTGLLLIFIFVFAVMFYIIGGLSYEQLEEDLSFWTCFCFSFQTMDQIGFGLLSPVSFSCDIAITLTSLLASFFWKFSGGIIFVKLSLPKKLKYLNRFSNVAVRNRNHMTFQEEGYHHGVDSLSFRIAATLSSSSICDSQFHLIYFRSKTDEMGYEKFEFQECDFEINRQLGRKRELVYSAPVLGLPWTVTHPIDEHSPLHGISLKQMEEENGELIGILVGIDEISSLTYQTRWSFKASEILEGREFVPCVRRDLENGFFTIDFKRLSMTRVLIPKSSPSNSVVKKSKLQKVKRRIRRTLSMTKTKLTQKLSQSFGAMPDLDLSPTRRVSLSSGKSRRNSFSCGSSPVHGIEDIFLDLRKMAIFGKKAKHSRDADFESPRMSLLSSQTYSSGSKNLSESGLQANESNY